MIFHTTALAGVFVIEPEPIRDERGFFSRTWCAQEFAERGLHSALAQCSISFNQRRGTLRGLHYQTAPHEEVKLVRCTRGAIFDVAVDIRPDSPGYLRWVGRELTAENRLMMYIPKGFAHGFVSLEDETEVFYQISEVYRATSARGIRWDDPAVAVNWPVRDVILSTRDAGFELLQGAAPGEDRYE